MFGEKNKKENINSYNKDQKELTLDYRKYLKFMMVILLVISLGVIGFYFLKSNIASNSTTLDSDVCEELITTDGSTEGLAPFRPVVKSKLLFEHSDDKAICEWKFNGVDAGATKPFEGNCIRDGLAYYTEGKTTISLLVKGTTCSRSIDLTVTGLSEGQQKADLETKTAEPPADAVVETKKVNHED